MTFKHKLSKRLAMLWDRALLLSAALILGCAPGDRTVAPSQPSFNSTTSQPGSVTDLNVTATTDTSVTLTFTAIDDGTGLPASYDVRFAMAPLSWGSARSVSQGRCKTPMAGAGVDSTMTCTVLGLQPNTPYDFQLVGFHGTLDVDAVFGELSNIAGATTASATPGSVTDLAASPASDTSVTLTFTEVNDGTGLPASYDVRFAVAPLSWGSATEVARGTCQAPMAGTWIGAKRSCNVRSLTPATNYRFQVVAFRDTLDVNAVFGELSNVAAAATPTANPGTVTNLAVVGATDSSVTLSFTEVGDGAGSPASYDVRLAAGTISWSSARSVTSGSCATPVAGTAIGAQRTCTVLGLAPSTGYQWQLVAFRGTLNVDAVFGAFSNVASGSTSTLPSPVPVASVVVTPAAVAQTAGTTQQFSAVLKDSTGALLTGRAVTWTSSNPGVATIGGTGLETSMAAGTATIRAMSEGRSGTAAVTVTTAVTDPGTVADLAVVGTTDSSVTLSFTEVTNGAGQPASYDIRYAAGALSWASATSVSRGTCSTPVVGSVVGARRTCTVLGLVSATAFRFQLVAFRGTLNVDAVFGAFSNIASGTTGTSTAPVASVTVNPASASVGVAQTRQLAALLKDAAGNTLTGRAVTWTSSAPLLATVNGSGLVTGLLAGAATITATSEGQSGSSAVTVTALAPPPTGGAGEPVFNAVAGDVQIYQDNMDQYTTPHDMDSWPGYSIHPFYPDQYPNNYAVITSAHGGSGKALRLVYINGGGERFIWKTNPENISTWYAPANAAFVLQYWFRISKNGGPGGGPGYGSTAVGMKWVEFWNVGAAARTQFSVTAGNATTGPLWHVNPASRGPMGYQPVGPYWNQVNNNQWHRVTYLYQPASSAGATDGIARMWIDGTKIVDVSAAAAGITPPGGTKVWCTLAEVAQLDTYQTAMINLGEYMNGAAGDGVTNLPMALDFDDFLWWKLPARLP